MMIFISEPSNLYFDIKDACVAQNMVFHIGNAV